MVAAARRVSFRPALRASIDRLDRAAGAALAAWLLLAPGAAAQPPVPSSPSATCGAVVGGVCYVNASFNLTTSSAGSHHYRYCRSGDTTAWGGCESTMSSNAGPLFVVSGSNLPADGYRRAYYASACDSSGTCTLWKDNAETYVTGDFSGPAAPGKTFIPCTYQNGNDCWVTGAFTMSVTPAFDAGSGVSSYTACRSHDTTAWGGCDATLAIGIGTSYTVSGSHLPADGYRRAYYFRAKDRLANQGAWNAESYVRVDRYAPTVTLSNHSTEWFSSRTVTLSAADVTGGAAANSGVASLRYAWNTALNAGCTNGTEVAPGTTLSVPEGDNVLNACVRDHTGRVTKTSGIYRVDSAPPTQPGPTTVACAYVGSDCWVTGDFVASTTGSTDDGTGVAGYRFCRSFDTTSSGGCNHDVVPQGTAGTSMTVSGSDLPADGFRRAYFFRAVDEIGNWSAWNARRYVRVDRHAPTVSAGGASTQWLTASSATVTAADDVGGAEANSGLAEVRYRWNAPLDGACTHGSPVAVGASLPAPEGDNTLYLCARDNTGRVAAWSGVYRVDDGVPSAPGPTTVACDWDDGTDCWVTGDFVASAAPATDGGAGVEGYRFCRSQDTQTTAGCAVDVVPQGTAGTSVAVSGSHLPSDGYRRRYFFRAVDSNGNWGPWNVGRYVRVDRYDPVPAAGDVSLDWFTERTATIVASDVSGGVAANSGLEEVRYQWNHGLLAACTDGTATSAGEVLSVPEGDNRLFVCARDRTGRVKHWAGTFRVDTTSPTLDSLTVSSPTWKIGDGSTYQITARVTDTGSGIRELRALINRDQEEASRRGNFSWRDASLGYLWTGDQVACSGGGFASKRPDAFNPETVTLVGCSTSVVGAQRTVTFTVRPELSFGESGPVNDISLWSRDFALNQRGWTPFDLNFGASFSPPPTMLVRDDQGVVLPHGATMGWGTVAEGSFDGRLERNVAVKNVAPAGSSLLRLEGSPANLEISGSTAFRLVGSLDPALAPGEQDAFTLRLDTDLLGNHQAEVRIWHDDPSRPNPTTFLVSAEVTAAPVVTDEIFPILQRGTSSTITIRGRNFQDAVLSIGTEAAEEGGTAPSRSYPTVELLSVDAAGTEIRARVHTQGAEIDGFYNVGIVTPGGSTGTPIRVVGPEPVVDLWTPSEPVSGRVHVLQVIGANLQGVDLIPNSPGVVILDLDNTDDRSLSGLIYVSPDTPDTEIDLQINGPGGSTRLPMELQPDVLTTSLTTRELATGSGQPGEVAPRILLQDPRSAFSIGDGEAGDGASNEIREKWLTFCFSYTRTRTYTFGAVLFTLYDGSGNPLVRDAINSMIPGDTLDFTSVTLAVIGYVQFEFSFRGCSNGVTDVSFCIRGGIEAMIPAVGGWGISYDLCHRNGTPSIRAANGRITKHEYSASNSCFDVSDTTSPAQSELGERPGQLTMNCCADTSITLSTSGVVFDIPFDFGDVPILDVEPLCVPPSFGLAVQEISFQDDLQLERSTVGRTDFVLDPIWVDDDLDGVPDGDPVTRPNVAAYVRGHHPRLLAKFVVDPLPTEPTEVLLRAQGPGDLIFDSESISVASDTIEAELSTAGYMPFVTAHLDPMRLEWTYSVDGGSHYEFIATTEHEVFVTLDNPITSPGHYLTLTALELGIGSGGTFDQEGTAAMTWQRFAGPANIETWDGRPLRYYPEGKGFGECSGSALGMLQSTDGAGQCGAFVHLLADALAVNGIPSDFIEAKHESDLLILIDNWAVVNETVPDEIFSFALILEYEDINLSIIGMVPLFPEDTPPDGVYGDMKSLPGIPGQNSTTPSEKVFDRHHLLRIPVLENKYHDPSYGIVYDDEADFQLRAVTGFAKHFDTDPPTLYFVRLTPTTRQELTGEPAAPTPERNEIMFIER